MYTCRGPGSIAPNPVLAEVRRRTRLCAGLAKAAIVWKLNHMVNRHAQGPWSATALDRTFHALADPTRRAIVATLSDRDHTIGDLAAPLPMSLVAVSKHITVLERAGMLRRTRAGRAQVCTLLGQPLDDASGWLEHYRLFWAARVDSLERYLGTAEK
jgi:DNA-binding transcriptional ArsR family regulator